MQKLLIAQPVLPFMTGEITRQHGKPGARGVKESITI
jgi:hypothetical protein